jgi:hypothetical protein
MVGASGSPAPPTRGLTVDVFTLNGGRSWIFYTASQGPAVDVFTLDGGRSGISGTASQGARHRRFQVEWWTLSDLQHRLPGGPSSTFFVLNGGRSRISGIAPQGARR